VTSPAPVSEVRIVADRLTKRFGDFIAVNAVSFEAKAGEIIGFLGPNGAGKSTTIRILCGLLRPSDGKATVAGYDVARFPERVREHIGYMSQKFSLYCDLSVMENLHFFGGVYGVQGARLEKRLKFAIGMAGLTDRTDAMVADLSGGWKQRLALGCAVLHEPAILFLDEPTSGVDPASRRRFWDLIYSLAGDGVCVVITTHYMDEAEYCNRIALINAGKLAALGSPSELKRSAIHGEILLLEGDDPGGMLEALEGSPGVRDVAPFGRRSTSWSMMRRATGRRSSRFSNSAGLAGRASSRSSRRSRMCSCSSSAGTGRGTRPHESSPRQGDCQEGGHSDLARSAQPDGRSPDAAHANGVARLWRQSGYRACANLRLRPRGKPTERIAHEGLSGVGLFQHRRDRARL
jgi:ABC-2 type transport system ATP-binding protein